MLHIFTTDQVLLNFVLLIIIIQFNNTKYLSQKGLSFIHVLINLDVFTLYASNEQPEPSEPGSDGSDSDDSDDSSTTVTQERYDSARGTGPAETPSSEEEMDEADELMDEAVEVSAGIVIEYLENALGIELDGETIQYIHDQIRDIIDSIV